MWRDMDPIWLAKQVKHLLYDCYIVGMISRRGFRVEVHHRNQPNKS